MLAAVAACSPRGTPTLFVPPTAAALLPTSAISPAAGSTPAVLAITPTPSALPTTHAPCNNNLSFVQDLTIPDGTAVTPGEPVDKQWLVTNSGTCDWDAGYRLKFISGDAMQAVTEQALYPARAGTQATLRIILTAPAAAGAYQSAWQAFSPEGIPFGEAVYVQISVSP